MIEIIFVGFRIYCRIRKKKKMFITKIRILNNMIKRENKRWD